MAWQAKIYAMAQREGCSRKTARALVYREKNERRSLGRRNKRR